MAANATPLQSSRSSANQPKKYAIKVQPRFERLQRIIAKSTSR
jgi:hypothetical protein